MIDDGLRSGSSASYADLLCLRAFSTTVTCADSANTVPEFSVAQVELCYCQLMSACANHDTGSALSKFSSRRTAADSQKRLHRTDWYSLLNRGAHLVTWT